MSLRRTAALAAQQGARRSRTGGYTFTPAESATILPLSAIWISQQGVTTVSGEVDVWASYLGGVACTIDAPAATNRLAYNATGGVGGRPLITSDGVDNVLEGLITKGSAWDDYEIGVVGNRVAFGTALDIVFGFFIGATPYFYLNDQSTAAIRFTVNGGVNTTHTEDPDGLNRHWSGDSLAGTQNARITGAVVATASTSTPSRADGNTVALGARPAGTAAANFNYQAAYIGPVLDSTQRSYLREMLTFYTGITS